MDLIEKYWEYVSLLLERDFGRGHPKDWAESDQVDFLKEFLKRVYDECKNDPEKQKRCGIFIKSDGQLTKPSMGLSTIQRILRYGTNLTGTKSREMFAIYFGSSSYDDFLKTHDLREGAPLPDLKNDKRTETIADVGSSNSHRTPEDKKRRAFFFLLFFAALALGMVFFVNQNTPVCTTEAITKDQFILVRTDEGIHFIDPDKDINQVLAEGPDFTGFAYDQRKQILFWSNSGPSYRTVGIADLSNGLIDKGLNHRYIKSSPCPIGIALDTSAEILYIADYGEIGRLNDGSIRAYDYEGNFLKIIYQDSIDPSSIILDATSQVLYWTDPRKKRIGYFDLNRNLGNPNFLVDVGAYPDGMVLDDRINRLYWASNKDSLIGWVNLDNYPLQPTIRKLHETATALALNPETGRLLYTSYDQEKIKWLEIEGDSVTHSACGQTGIQTSAGSPGVIQLHTR